jgi:hypothetical protein
MPELSVIALESGINGMCRHGGADPLFCKLKENIHGT